MFLSENINFTTVFNQFSFDTHLKAKELDTPEYTRDTRLIPILYKQVEHRVVKKKQNE